MAPGGRVPPIFLRHGLAKNPCGVSLERAERSGSDEGGIGKLENYLQPRELISHCTKPMRESDRPAAPEGRHNKKWEILVGCRWNERLPVGPTSPYVKIRILGPSRAAKAKPGGGSTKKVGPGGPPSAETPPGEGCPLGFSAWQRTQKTLK